MLTRLWRYINNLLKYRCQLLSAERTDLLSTSFLQSSEVSKSVTTKEMSLQTFPENSQWRRRRDIMQPGSCDRKSSTALSVTLCSASEVSAIINGHFYRFRYLISYNCSNWRDGVDFDALNDVTAHCEIQRLLQHIPLTHKSVWLCACLLRLSLMRVNYLLSVCLHVCAIMHVCVCVCVVAPYTSEEEEDDVNPREKKQVGRRRDVAADVTNDVIYFSRRRRLSTNVRVHSRFCRGERCKSVI